MRCVSLKYLQGMTSLLVRLIGLMLRRCCRSCGLFCLCLADLDGGASFLSMRCSSWLWHSLCQDSKMVSALQDWLKSDA